MSLIGALVVQKRKKATQKPSGRRGLPARRKYLNIENLFQQISQLLISIISSSVALEGIRTTKLGPGRHEFCVVKQ